MPRYFKREGRGKGYEDVTREVAALRAELHTAVVLGNGWKHAAQEEGAELERVTTERDAMRPVVEAAKACADCDCESPRHDDDGNLFLPKGGYPCAWDCPHLEGLLDAVDAYRAARSGQEAPTCSCGKPERGRGPWHAPGRCAMYAGALDLPIKASEQERCECVPAVDEDGAPDGYEYVCNLHEKASEREASDAPA